MMQPELGKVGNSAPGAGYGTGGNPLGRQFKLLALMLAFAVVANLVSLSAAQVTQNVYVPVHTLLEFVSIQMAFLVFGTVWFTASKHTSASQVVIGIALLMAAYLDFMHMMSIDGMPEFVTASGTQKSFVFWLAARADVAIAVLIASFIPVDRPLSSAIRRAIALAFTLYAAGITLVVLGYPDLLPSLYVMKSGSTTAKLTVEVLIVGTFSCAAYRYYRAARSSNESYFALMFCAMAVTAMGELFFTHTNVASDAQKLFGHLYKIVSYWLMFKAMFKLSIRKPYQQLADQAGKLATLNASLQVQSLALESTLTPVIVTDIHGVITWQNRASALLSNRITLGQTTIYDAAYTPELEDVSQMRHKLAQGQIWRGKVNIPQGGKDSIYLDRTVTPVRGTNGDVEGYVCVSENITQSVLSEVRHRRVLETALDGYWVMDHQSRIIEVNDSFCKMTGYAVNEIMTMCIHDFIPANRQYKIPENIHRIKTLGNDRFHTKYLKKDGELLPVDVAATYDAQSGQFFVFVRDCTEQERAASARLDLERQLQHAQKMQALGQLTGGIAHDFNNVLASILGYSNLALSRFAQDSETKLHKYLREIVVASERARDLIAKMLTFTRNQPSDSASVISPLATIREVVDMLRPSLPSSIQLTVSADTDQAIRIDSGELNQILVNLIINARDAIPSHGAIKVSLRNMQAEGQLCAITNQRLGGNFVSIEVADTGTGIAAEHMSSLFNPFFTTKDVGKGTGLGLAMVRGIMQKNSGHVLVHSADRMGTQFELLFPVAEQPVAVAPVVSELPDSQTGSGETIWIVDDEQSVARFVGDLMMDSGYNVRIFNDPLIALSAFRANQTKVQLLITDQTMPGFTGIQLVGQMQQIRRDLPVIICTGYSEGIDGKALERHVIEEVLIKPVLPQQLLDSVARILAKTGASVQHRPRAGAAE